MEQYPQRMRSYIDALEVEKTKIRVFERELPLCLDIVNEAIGNFRQQLSETTTECRHRGQSECSEQTSTRGPVLEEFIPIKRPCFASEEDELHYGRMPTDVNGNVTVAVDSSDNMRKSDWLRSAQPWNQTAQEKDDPSPKRVPVQEVKRTGGGGALLSLDKAQYTIPVSGSKEDEKPANPKRKQRRIWSPELQGHYLQALEQLGGPYAATPNQIRELMTGDGLTQSEVKSHLQKYRLVSGQADPSRCRFLLPAP